MVEPSTVRHEAHRGDSGFAEANAGLQPAVVLKPDRDNETSVIRGPATMKAGRWNSYGPVRYRRRVDVKIILIEYTKKIMVIIKL